MNDKNLKWTGSLLALGLIFGVASQGTPAIAASPSPSLASERMNPAIERVKPALVRIHVITADWTDGQRSLSEAYGSGAIISSDGYIITNHHVAGDAVYVTCTLSNQEEIEASLVGTDPLTDLAVLKLKPETPRKFSFVNFGNSNELKVGDSVYAMGSPLAFSQSVTEGVVSNTHLVLSDVMDRDGFQIDGEDVSSVMLWIAHDADIYPGNSGGPLVDQKGDIVGINEISIGLSGAIPGNLAKLVSDQIIHQGRIHRSWTGVYIQPLIRDSGIKEGVLVADVADNSPAKRAGIQSGDILTQMDGIPVCVRFKEDLPQFNQQIMALPIGKQVPITLLRDGKEVTVQVTPEERAPARGECREYKDWGFVGLNITSTFARANQLKSTQGVWVNGLRSGGPADTARPAIKSSDIIIQVNDKPVNNLDDLSQITREALQGKQDPVPVKVVMIRGQERYATVVRIGQKAPEDTGREVSKAWFPAAVEVLTTDLAESMNLSDATGVIITQLYPNMGLDKAGFQVGDVITQVDGQAVEASQPEDTDVFPAMIRDIPIGNLAQFTVFRSGKKLDLSFNLPESPKLPREMKSYTDLDFDFTARDLAFLDRAGAGMNSDQQGALVSGVDSGGWAALARLQSNDIIVDLNGKAIDNVDTLKAVLGEIKKQNLSKIIITVKRGPSRMFLEMHSGKALSSDSVRSLSDEKETK